VVIHLAALAGVRPSISRPRLYAEVNIQGTLNLLELSHQFRVSRFIFGSSSAVYGADARAPFSEDATGLRPISPYADTKLAGELFCYTYSHLYRLSVVCLRFFTVYGPRQRPDLAIRKFAGLMDAGMPIPVYGDGTSGRDYTYVDDIVQGVLAAIPYKTDFDIFNLGNCHPVKLLELIPLLEKATGKPAEVEFHPFQPGDVPLTWANIDKARRLLGYEPRVSLEAGLRNFCAWRRAMAGEQAAEANGYGATAARLPAPGLESENGKSGVELELASGQS
jgi:UDP-glucuronate 4-epimerase